MDAPQLYTSEKILEVLRSMGFEVTKNTITRLIKRARNPLPYAKPLGKRLFPKDEFHEWLRRELKIVNDKPRRETIIREKPRKNKKINWSAV